MNNCLYCGLTINKINRVIFEREPPVEVMYNIRIRVSDPIDSNAVSKFIIPAAQINSHLPINLRLESLFYIIFSRDKMYMRLSLVKHPSRFSPARFETEYIAICLNII